ncbi:RNA-directed DNA polymerase (reverse transcriptase)-related family protein [Euphorbia peplus]|nr:RNA-directed DNA polymerase (reverse transcriptase)-related family protein [Euphorbia peplus]
MQVSFPGSDYFLFTAVYGSPSPVRRQTLWDGLTDISSQAKGPWVLAGDFNAILSTEDRRGGSDRRSGGCPHFQNFMNATSLIDLGFSGPHFTWKRGLLLQRLDRAIGNCAWLQKFPNTVISHLQRIKSDHRPILFSVTSSIPKPRNGNMFRFVRAWMLHPEYIDFVNNSWDPAISLEANIRVVADQLQTWNKNIFGNIITRKKKLLNRLSGIQHALELHSTPSTLKIEQSILNELESTLKQEEDLWHQKSRKKWVQEGDRNTAYFHQSTIVRRRRNLISGVRIDGLGWCTEEATIRTAARDFYKGLFADDRPFVPRFTCRGAFPGFSNVESVSLDGIPDDDEIKKALFDMQPWKAPGMDGFQAGFFQKHWDKMSTSICHFVKAAFQTGSFDPDINKTTIVLIPKVTRPEDFSELRPISLCNVSYKIITKIIANRLKPLMPSMVLPHQTSFVVGRNITDNIIIAQEAIHSMRNKTGRNGWMALKVDLEKAYDRLNWDFLDDTLQEAGIPQRLSKLIMFCVSSSSLQVLWNGTPTEPIFPTRGIRQGDPLSPYLFVLCMERLGHRITEECASGNWQPLTFGNDGTCVSHLFFADDLLLFSKATARQATVIQGVLNDFCTASGHQVSFSKSNIFYSKNVLTPLRMEITAILPLRPTTDLGKYLGVPLLHTRVQRSTYQYIIDGIHSKLSGWASHTLSLAGRITLAKSVLSAIPYYTMQTVSLPCYICAKIDELVRNFIWGTTSEKRKISLVRWEEVCTPTNNGGLGMRDTKTMNMAFITKLSFQFIRNPESLWARVLAAKYNTNDLLDPFQPARSDASLLWKAIVRTKDDLHIGLKWAIGDGTTTKFWKDNWVGDLGPLLRLATGPVDPNIINLTVADMMDESGDWCWPRFIHLLPELCIYTLAASLGCRLTSGKDQAFWMGSSSGLFTVKSAYSIISDDFSNGGSNMWKDIWRWDGPHRIRSFLWLATKGKLLTNSERTRRHLDVNDMCPVCNIHTETIVHVFRDCLQARSVWLQLLPICDFLLIISMDEENWVQNCISDRFQIFVENWVLMFVVTCWVLWKNRNVIVFQGGKCTILDIVTSIKIRCKDIIESNRNRDMYKVSHKANRVDRLIGWSRPRPGWVKLNTDGAVKGNSFRSSAGGLIRDCNGNWIRGFSKKIGSCSVLKAELWGILEGLKMSWDMGLRKVQVEVDNQLCVDLIGRSYCTPNDVAALLMEIQEYIGRSWEINVCHIYREANRSADWMANLGDTLPLGLHLFTHAPAGVCSIVIQDNMGISFLRFCIM